MDKIQTGINNEDRIREVIKLCNFRVGKTWVICNTCGQKYRKSDNLLVKLPIHINLHINFIKTYGGI